MSRFAKIATVATAYSVIVFLLIFVAFRQATSSVLFRQAVQNGNTGIFTMFGFAILGLSIVTAVIVFAIAKEPNS